MGNEMLPPLLLGGAELAIRWRPQDNSRWANSLEP